MRGKLKPCPFCGGDADDYSYYDEDISVFMSIVECNKCGAKFELFNERKVFVDKLWNTRVIQPTNDDVWHDVSEDKEKE